MTLKDEHVVAVEGLLADMKHNVTDAVNFLMIGYQSFFSLAFILMLYFSFKN